MTRREKGMGSVSQRKDGSWTARVTLGVDSNGKRKVKALYGKTEREVKKKLKGFQQELIKNDYKEVQKTTVEEYMNDWLLHTKRNELKPSSYDRLEETCKYQIYPFIGYCQIHELTATHIQKLINSLTEKGYSYSTIKKAYNALHSCLMLAYEREEIRKNPFVGIALPKQVKKDISDIVYFTEEETELIEHYALERYGTGKYKYENGWFIILLLYTGLRVGELLALKWENIDLVRKTLRVSGNLKQVKDRDESSDKAYKIIEQTPKTKSGNRIVPLADRAIEALDYLSKHRKHGKFVAVTKNGNSVPARNIDRAFRQIIKATGIEKTCGVHSLRHTFASMLFKRGVDVKTVSEILGHSDVSVTYNIYIHIIDEQKFTAIDLLNKPIRECGDR